MIEVNSETDFVAKNDEFIALAKGCAELVATRAPADVAALSACPWAKVPSSPPLRPGRQDRRKHVDPPLRAAGGQRQADFLRPWRFQDRRRHRRGRRRRATGQDLAMHIAASKPKSLDASGVSAELIETERRIAIEKARADNKPEAMLERLPKAPSRSTSRKSPCWPRSSSRPRTASRPSSNCSSRRALRWPASPSTWWARGIEKKVSTSPPKWPPRPPPSRSNRCRGPRRWLLPL